MSLRKRNAPPFSTPSETDTLLGSVSTSTPQPRVSLKVRKRLLSITAFFVSVAILLPTSLHLAFGEKLTDAIKVTVVVIITLVVSGYIAVQMHNDNKARRKAREERDYSTLVSDSTYRCVAPQIIGSMVVVPVVVVRRDAGIDRVLRLTDDAIRVELCQGGKREDFQGADRWVGRGWTSEATAAYRPASITNNGPSTHRFAPRTR